MEGSATGAATNSVKTDLKEEANNQIIQLSRLIADAIKDKDETTRGKYEEQRTYLTNRLKLIKAKEAAGAGRKRSITVLEGTGLRKFMRQMVLQPLPLKSKLGLPSSVPLEDRIISLGGMELNDKAGYPGYILFRQCYEDYWVKYIKPALMVERKNVFIGGAEGIGKSVFTDLLALLLVEEHEVVLLQHFEERLLLVGNNPNPGAIEEVKWALGKWSDYDPESVSTTEPAVYSIGYDVLFDNLVKMEHLVVIQDLGNTNRHIVSSDGRTRKIWISSPNDEKLRTIRDDVMRLNLIIPPLSVDEMLTIRNHWNPHDYTEEEVRERYALCGGSVRFVLESSKYVPADICEKAIGAATRESLLKHSMNESLFHPIPRQGDPTRLQLRFASEYISEKLFNKFISREQRSARTFLAVVKDAPELAAFAGFVLEDEMHNQILRGLKVQAKELGSTTARRINLPKLRLVGMFSSETFSDVNVGDLCENGYFRPKTKTFPTIDSFAILPLSIFVPGAKGLCLVTFQSTAVSKSHKTEGVILERLFQVVRTKLGDVRRFHVFLTGPNGIKTKQKVDTQKVEGGAYAAGQEPNVQQWAMTLGDEFDELFDRFEEVQSDIAIAEE